MKIMKQNGVKVKLSSTYGVMNPELNVPKEPHDRVVLPHSEGTNGKCPNCHQIVNCYTDYDECKSCHQLLIWR